MCAVPLLVLDDLRVGPSAGVDGVGGPTIDGVSLTIEAGRCSGIVGPPGAGLDALVGAIAGAAAHPVTGGRVLLGGDDVTTWPTDVRARAGLFVSDARAEPMGGVTPLQLLSQAVGARRGVDTDVSAVRRAMVCWARELALDPAVLDRPLNHDLSPADARRSDLLQLAVLEPAMAVIDEPAEDLPAEVVTALAAGLDAVRAKRPTLGTLTITHCRRLIEQLRPDHLSVMVGGRIVAAGGPELAEQLDTEGYENFT